MKIQFYESKKYFLCFIFFLFSTVCNVSAQQYLTKIDGWNAYVHLPDDYYDSLDKTYPLICFIPGLGEIGTDASKLLIYGPSKYINSGHNMQFMVNGKLEKPIVISIQPSAAWPHPPTLNRKLDSIVARFRCDLQRINVTGLSMGGWSWNNFVDGYNTIYTNRITSIVSMSAPEPDNTYSNMRLFALAGGKIWGFEGNNDLRGMTKIRDTMNKYVPASVRYTQYIGGHCCWNTYYNPNWVENGESVYTWMLKQKKPTPPAAIPPIADAGTDEVIPTVTPSVTLNGFGNDPFGLPISFSWTKIDGPAQGNLTNVANAQTSVSGMTLGTYRFELSVTNALGLKGKDTIIIYNGESVMPVKLTDFSGKKFGNSVLLQWLTATEMNVDYFAIETSIDGLDFVGIGTVAATNNTGQRYEFSDLNPESGLNFYRLKMMDKDGQFEYSKTISVRYNSKLLGSAWLLNAFSAHQNLQLSILSSKAQIVRVMITDATGRNLLQHNVQLISGKNKVDFLLPYAKGVYFIRMENGTEKFEPKAFFLN